MKNIFMNWQLGNAFGWGILGLNIFMHWANDPDIRPLMARPITDDDVAMCDPLKFERAFRAMDFSNRFCAGIQTDARGMKNVAAILLDSLGNGFPQSQCYGTRNIAR